MRRAAGRPPTEADDAQGPSLPARGSQAEAHADEDRQRREEVETRNQAEQLTYQAERTLSDLGDKVSAEDRAAKLVRAGWLSAGCLRGRRVFAALERWQTRYLPVYGVWAAIVVVVFPPVFAFFSASINFELPSASSRSESDIRVNYWDPSKIIAGSNNIGGSGDTLDRLHTMVEEERVVTRRSYPSYPATGVEHDVCSFGIFSILTTHTRHEPSTPRPG